jgi:3',5'-cyclic AMP phosphodiesterase CpdA
MKIIHVTDTHLVALGGTVGRCDPLDNFRAFVQHVNTHHADAALCVITGDLVHAGELAAYRLLRTELSSLTMPTRLLIGNHDDRTNFLTVFPETPCDESGFVQSVMDTDAGRLLFIDTNERGTHRGHICERRRPWLAARIEESGGDAYLFMHHPPASLGVAAVDDIRLVEEAWFMSLIATHRERIRHIFFGHTHLNVAGSIQGIPFSCPRSTNHQTYPAFGARDALQACQLSPTYSVVLLSGQRTACHFVEYRYAGPVWTVGTYAGGYTDPAKL